MTFRVIFYLSNHTYPSWIPTNHTMLYNFAYDAYAPILILRVELAKSTMAGV